MGKEKLRPMERIELERKARSAFQFSEISHTF